MKLKSPGKRIGFALFFLFSLLSPEIGAQNFFGQPYQHVHNEKCAHVLIEKMQEEKMGFYGTKEYFESWISKEISEKKKNFNPLQRIQAERRVIPVVVHVIHNGTPEGSGANIPFSQIEAQIRIINEDFRRQNADTTLTPQEFLGVVADANIEFVLARQDPKGLPTNGVVRVKGPKTVYNPNIPSDIDLIGQTSLWPPEDYMNIWVVTIIDPIIGFASLPISNLPGLNVPPNSRENDGVTIDYRYFGEGGNAASGSKGRTATHEIGHFLGLRHIWGDGDCSVDDFVLDTPLQSGPNNACRTVNPKISCNTRDLVENYMDYTPDDCMNNFTFGQVERMDVVLAESPRRASLVNGRGTIAPQLFTLDLAMQRIIDPQNLVCDLNINPTLEILNRGLNRVTAARIEIRNNGLLIQTKNFSLNLNTGDATTVSFDPINFPSTGNNFVASITQVNGTTDQNPSNNSLSSNPSLQPAIPLPYAFQFNEIGTNWVINNPDNLATWEKTQVVLDGQSQDALFIRNYEYEAFGELDYFISPGLDLSTYQNAQLTFNMAYGPFNNNSFGDYLLVAVSTDCGNTFDIIEAPYEKDYVFLRTSTPTLDEFIPTSASQFRREIVNLSEYSGLENVRIAFIARNGFGNNLYIKDIEILTAETYKYDLKLTELITPSAIGSNKHENEVVSVTNTGNLPISGFIFRRTSGSSNQAFIARADPLAAGESANISLPKSTSLGINSLAYSILFPNFDQNEREPIELRRFVYMDTLKTRVPFRQNFDNNPNIGPWLTINPENRLPAWNISPLQSGSLGSNVITVENTPPNNSFWLGSPILDLSISPQASVFFDRAAGIVNPNTILKVLASDNGGDTYTEVYRKTGSEITTVQAANANPNNVSEFVRDFVDLTAFAGTNKKNSRIAFVLENSDEENSSVYLDNIELFISANPEPVIPNVGEISLYPNPAVEYFNVAFNFQTYEAVNIQIYSSTGALIHNVDYPNTLNQTYTFASEQFSKGLFILKITSRSVSETRKLFLQ
ncbi:M43 family zinc metalloprotease [Cognataquiflexum rubidum]|uniref:M43 family zinc metalloprotease n=1 Tax=Cognataquiflexum rubidum TaxID=2922273 RepID=UPI001F1472C7|nr:M43 family zinc metalloprotease [Cognataquiflexum rubidum]MCH6235114.1 zinc-dependent metalloprotease [Cognataquiflexum rubidum]